MKEKDTPDNSSVNIDLIRGHMDTIILRTLSDGDKYGYEILSEISDKSEGLYSLKQPTLYSCLKRLEKQGLVTSYKGDLSYGAQRVYYSLTDMGRQFLENDQIQWEFSRTIINSLLSDRAYDPEKAPKPFDVSSFRPLTRRQRGDANYYATVDPAKLTEEELNAAAQAEAPDESADDSFDSSYDGSVVYSEGDVTPAEIPAQNYPHEDESAQAEIPSHEDESVEIVEDGDIPPVPEPAGDSYAGEPAHHTERIYRDYTSDMGEASPAASDTFTEEIVQEEVYNLPKERNNASHTEPSYEEDQSEQSVIEENEAIDSTPAEEEVSYDEEGAVEDVYAAEESGVQELPLNYDTSVYEYDEEAARRAADVLYGAPPEPQEEEPVEPAPPVQPLPVYSGEGNYIESLGKFYNRNVDEQAEEDTKPAERPSAAAGDPPTLSQVREAFYMQGFTLKPYTKTTYAGYYINKYFYSNKLLRDCTLIMFVIFAAELLICALAGGISWAAFGLTAGISLLVPIFMMIAYLIEPNRRKRANYNFKSALLSCLAFCLIYIILVFILGFFVFGVRADMISTWVKPVFIPLVFMLDVPIAVLIYTKLYSSRKYHIN